VTIAFLDGASIAAPRPHHMVVSSHSWGRGRAKRVAVAVSGEIDAANAREFASVVRDVCAGHAVVTLDLTDIDFMAVDGVTALHAINAHLLRAGVTWRLVPNALVQRLLALCDPAGVLPVATEPVRHLAAVPALPRSEPA
jgi:anti-anti-sigma factor